MGLGFIGPSWLLVAQWRYRCPRDERVSPYSGIIQIQQSRSQSRRRRNIIIAKYFFGDLKTALSGAAAVARVLAERVKVEAAPKAEKLGGD